MRIRLTFPALLAALLLMAGCEQPLEPARTTQPSSASVLQPWLADLYALGNALAVAVEDEGVRAELRDALRDSPYNEHKLSLHEFLHGRAGASTYDAMSAVVNGGLDGLEGLLSSVPPMDLYLPIRTHRVDWRPEMPLAVGVTPDPDLPSLTLGKDNGHGRAIAPVDAAQRFQGLLVIHPAEFKHVRVGDTPYRGQGVQDPDETSVAGAIIRRDPTGRIISTTEFADIRPLFTTEDHCDPEMIDCTHEGDGGQSCSGVVLDEVMVRFGDGVGSAEVEWTLWDDHHTGSTLRVVDLHVDTWKDVHLCFWDGVVSYPEGNWFDAGNLHALETDAFSDDDWGYGNVSSGDSGQIVETTGFCDLIGDPNTQYDPACDFDGTTITTRVVIRW
jgi:hypothetical protein